MTDAVAGPNDGTIIYTNCEVPAGENTAVLNALFLLINNASTTDAGHWVQFYPFKGGTLETDGSNTPTFSLQLYGSNANNQPADSYDGYAIGSAVTALGITAVTLAPRWIKAKLNSISGSDATVTAILNAFAP
jgi:hypothetical protein